MGNLIEHAKKELQAIGYNLEETEEGPNKWIVKNILELLDVFSKQGHSGFSASYCVSLFAKLASLEPACPLTGKGDEWNEVGEGIFQNKRCSHVFKGADGRAYDIDGKIFRDPNGALSTNIDSRVYIEFPYTPKSEYIDRKPDDANKG